MTPVLTVHVIALQPAPITGDPNPATPTTETTFSRTESAFGSSGRLGLSPDYYAQLHESRAQPKERRPGQARAVASRARLSDPRAGRLPRLPLSPDSALARSGQQVREDAQVARGDIDDLGAA
jgi:hypothetical protein